MRDRLMEAEVIQLSSGPITQVPHRRIGCRASERQVTADGFLLKLEGRRRRKLQSAGGREARPDYGDLTKERTARTLDHLEPIERITNQTPW